MAEPVLTAEQTKQQSAETKRPYQKPGEYLQERANAKNMRPIDVARAINNQLSSRYFGKLVRGERKIAPRYIKLLQEPLELNVPYLEFLIYLDNAPPSVKPFLAELITQGEEDEGEIPDWYVMVRPLLERLRHRSNKEKKILLQHWATALDMMEATPHQAEKE